MAGLAREASYLWNSDVKYINNVRIAKTTTSGGCKTYFSPSDNTVKDLAWDGTYIWAINTSGTMKQFTTDGVLVNSIVGLLHGGWGLTYGDGCLWASNPKNDMIYKISTTSGIEDENKYAYEKFNLLQNYPNPFSRSTVINYSIGSHRQLSEDRNQANENRYVLLAIYDRTGRLVKTLVNKFQPPGNYSVTWDGTYKTSLSVASGVYFYILKSEGFNITKKMIIVR